jgi:hypothetical protein
MEYLYLCSRVLVTKICRNLKWNICSRALVTKIYHSHIQLTKFSFVFFTAFKHFILNLIETAFVII